MSAPPKKLLQVVLTINTGIIPDVANIIAQYSEIKKFELGFKCLYFKVVRKTAKSLFVLYWGCNVEHRKKLFYDEFGGEYAKHNSNLIFPN